MFKLEKISLGYTENKKEYPAGLVMFSDTDDDQYLEEEKERVEMAYGKKSAAGECKQWFVRITDANGNVFETSNAPK